MSAANEPAAVLPNPDGITRSQGPIATLIYWGIHAACFLAIFTGVNATDIALCAGAYLVRMFAITGAYHRYFSHRTYRTSRLVQFVIGFVGTSAVQKGPLWWAANHRMHHRYSDGQGDPHSPRDGFYWSHQGWIADGRWDDTRLDLVRDLAKYPELVWLNRWHIVAPIMLAVFCYAVGGFSGLIWGFAISTVVCWHSTYSINSLAHRWGTVRYDTGDDSRNNFFLALLTLGEGWHNNHHFHQASARQGFFWWEIDITYYLLRGMQAVGLVWDIKEPPARVYREVARKVAPEAETADSAIREAA
jgi:stearoyl-CoA desaturase (delta-9 desaturase)